MSAPTPEEQQRPEDQPLPVPDPSRGDVQALVIADIEARRQVGIQRYGTPLQTWNGRKTMRDIYEELLDAACYVRQRMEEHEDVEMLVKALRWIVKDAPADTVRMRGVAREALERWDTRA